MTARLSAMRRLCALTLAFLMLTAPARAAIDDAALESGRLPKTLSALGVFTDGPGMTPASARMLPYDLITPLFTDYAAKYRFVYVPEGKTGAYDPENALDLPVGSALIKTFAYPADMREPEKDVRLIETRVLAHTERGWQAFPYIWNAEGTDAVLSPLGAVMDVSWIDGEGERRETRYLVPNRNQCKGCHVKGTGRDRAMTPIGPKAKHLNRPFDYGGKIDNQLAAWTKAGLIEGTPDPDDAPRVARWDDETAPLADRARAYLDINCAHCHAPDGPAYTSGLFLSTEIADPVAYGVFKHPVAAGRGSGGRDYDIVPGEPEASILVYRMDSTDPGVMMPELGRTMNHDEGIALIRAWVAQMDN